MLEMSNPPAAEPPPDCCCWPFPLSKKGLASDKHTKLTNSNEKANFIFQYIFFWIIGKKWLFTCDPDKNKTATDFKFQARTSFPQFSINLFYCWPVIFIIFIFFADQEENVSDNRQFYVDVWNNRLLRKSWGFSIYLVHNT